MLEELAASFCRPELLHRLDDETVGLRQLGTESVRTVADRVPKETAASRMLPPVTFTPAPRWPE